MCFVLFFSIKMLHFGEIQMRHEEQFEIWTTKDSKNKSEWSMSILQRLFVCSGATECCHSCQPFLTRTIFYGPFREDLSFPFPVVWPRLSCRERGAAKRDCRCTVWQTLHGLSWPDKSRARNTAIYLYSLWFCVLRPRHSDPGWIFQQRMKTDGWLSIDILKGTWRLMSDPYVLIECKLFMCGLSP